MLIIITNSPFQSTITKNFKLIKNKSNNEFSLKICQINLNKIFKLFQNFQNSNKQLQCIHYFYI